MHILQPAEKYEYTSRLEFQRQTRLVKLAVLNSEEYVYRLPAGEIKGIFDGPVMLQNACFDISDDGRQMTMRYPPAKKIRALVES